MGDTDTVFSFQETKAEIKQVKVEIAQLKQQLVERIYVLNGLKKRKSELQFLVIAEALHLRSNP